MPKTGSHHVERADADDAARRITILLLAVTAADIALTALVLAIYSAEHLP